LYVKTLKSILVFLLLFSIDLILEGEKMEIRGAV